MPKIRVLREIDPFLISYHIFWFLFDVAIVNIFLCKHFTHLGITDLKTCTELAKSLIGSYCSRKRPGQPTQATPPPKRFCSSHFPVRGSDKQHQCHCCGHYKNKRHGICGTAMTASYSCVTMAKMMTVSFSTTEGMYHQPPTNLASTHFHYCALIPPPPTYTFAAIILLLLLSLSHTCIFAAESILIGNNPCAMRTQT